MNPATLIVWCVAIYSITFSLVMIGFSILSLLAYGCVLNYFEDNPILNILYFVYFRNAKCGSDVNWYIYGYSEFESNPNSIQPIMPSQTKAVYETFLLTWFYLGFNVLLVCACLLAMYGLKVITRRTFKYFIIYFIPLIVMIIVNIVLDTIAGIHYNIDNIMTTITPDAIMEILEIQNVDDVREIIEEIPILYIKAPSFIMMMVTIKGYILYAGNIMFVLILIPASWFVVRNRKVPPIQQVNFLNENSNYNMMEHRDPQLPPQYQEHSHHLPYNPQLIIAQKSLMQTTEQNS